MDAFFTATEPGSSLLLTNFVDDAYIANECLCNPQELNHHANGFPTFPYPLDF